MSDETPDIETPSDSEDAPKKRRVGRRGKASASEGASAPEAGSRTSDADATSDADVADDESADVAAAAEDVDTQAEEKPEPEAEADAETPAKPRRGRRGAKADTEKPAAAKPAPAKPAAPKPAPSRRRVAREPGAPIPVVRAQAKYVRSSPRKARLVCDHIRGKSVEEARAILAHTPRAVARDWSKLLESAVANAEHNHELVGEDLYVKSIHADDGPTIKRFRPRAMGRATKIRKRTSHLTILLTPKE